MKYMTKRQRALLNNATIQHKEHYKMYKSGGAWTFACIFLMSGLFWAAPAITANAATATTSISTTNSPVSGTSSQSAANDTSNQSNTVTGTANGSTATSGTAQTPTTGVVGTTQTVPTVKAATTTASTTTPTSSDGSTIAATQSKITTANLNGTNPANLNADGTISKADKTDVTTSSVQAVKDNFKAEQITKTDGKVGKPVDVSNTISNGGVTLVPAKTSNTAGTLVFKNQIDTSQAFTFNATFTSQADHGGGGIGFILQPVDPQDAGVGEGSDPSADIGIYGQPNTTFIGRDGYVDTSDSSVRADTDWTNLTIRQTDDKGQLTTTTPTWSNSSTPATPSRTIIPLTEYATLTWAPISGVVNQKVSGTLTYKTYSDAARTKLVQSLSTSSSTYISTTKISSITLNQSVSIAAFGAVGNLNNGTNIRTVQVADPKNTADVGGFTAKVNTMPIKITYVDQDGKTVLHAADTTNVNVGDSLTIAPTTDLSTNTFAPRPIDGYRFVKAVASDGSNTITVTNSVLNALTSNPNVNNITVYYTNQVSYTIQPVNAQGKSIAGLAPTQGTGKIGSSIAAPAYAGYTSGTSMLTVPTTDGSILPVTYTANQGNILVSYTGLPANLTPANGIFSGSVGSTYEIDSPTIAGYTSDQAAISGKVSKTGNASFTVTYKASNNSYQIIPVDASGKVIAALTAMTETSTTGSKIVTPTYAGYTLDSAQTLPMTQSGAVSYQVKYNATPYTVTVTYIGLPTALKSGTASGSIGTGYQINSPIVAGYTPDQTAVIGTFSKDDSISVTYTADTKVYKVQPVDASGVPIATLMPEQFSGQTGDKITYPNDYTGYTVKPNNEKVPAVSKPTPSINVEYDANPSTLTVDYKGLPSGDTSKVITGMTGGAYQVVTPTVAGYTPDRAIVSGAYSNLGSTTQTVTYTANNNSYTVTPVDADGNPIAGLSTTSETTPTNAKITIPDYSNQGYEPITGQLAQVTQPGVTNYQVKYQAASETVKVTYVGLPTNLTPVSQTQSGTLGKTYNFVSPTITGYTPDSAVISGTYTQNGETAFTVTYTANPETVTITAAGLDPTTATEYPVQTVSGKFGDTFTVNAPAIPGYTPDKAQITGTYSADSTNNMYVVTYTGQPASVTINYTGASANPKSVTLTGIVGGSYSQLTPSETNYTPNQATVAGMFTATDLTSKNVTVTVKYSPSTNAYTVEPVDTAGKPISGLNSTLVVAVNGQITLPDYSGQGYVHVVKDGDQYVVAGQSDNVITAPASNRDPIPETYQKQVSYTVLPVGTDGEAINTLASVNAIGLVGQVVIPPVEPGYELVDSSTRHTVQDTDSAGKSDIINIAYQAKPVTVTVVPVDGNGQVISGLQATVVTGASGTTPRGGTQLTVSAPIYAGYQPASSDNLNIAVPIQDSGMTIQVPYLKSFTTELAGAESETYTGKKQTIDPDDYTVNLPDGTHYSLTVNDLQLVPVDPATPFDSRTGATNAGDYKVQLTEVAKNAIKNSLSKNYAVTINNSTGTFTITQIVLTQPAANTAKVPVNVASPAENSQLMTSIVVQGATKVYDGDVSTTPAIFNVLAPSQYTDFNLPTLVASDFDISSVSQNAGSYQVTLNDQGIEALQAANPNYQFDATDVQNGLFVITKAPATITANNVTMSYNGKAYDDSKLTATTSTLPPHGDQLHYTLSTNGVTDVNASGYPITVTAIDNPNYDVTTQAGTLTVSQKQGFSIGVISANKVYDGNAANYTLSLPDGVQQPTSWNAADYTSAAPTDAGNYNVSLSAQGMADLQAANPNYDIKDAQVTGSVFAISQAPVTITANNATMTYNGQAYDDSKLTVTTSTLPPHGDQLYYTLSTNGVTDVNASGYPITVTVSATDNPNYDVKVNPGILTIKPQAVATIGVISANKMYDGQAADYTLSLPDGVQQPSNWSAVDYTLASPTNAGTYSVSLSAQGIADLQAANPNYDIKDAKVTESTFTISRVPVTITANDTSMTYNGQKYNDATLTATISTLPAQGAKLHYTLSSNGATDVNDGGYPITVTANTTDNPNYNITVKPGILTISQEKILRVGVIGASKTYDGQATQYKLSLPDGIQQPSNWSAVDYTLAAPTDAGTYSVSLSDRGIADLQAANPNYDIKDAQVNGSTFTISQAPVTIIAANATMIYSGQAYNDSTLTANTPELPKNGAQLHYTLSTNGVTDVNANGYPITVTASTTANPNYLITVKPGILTIRQQAVTTVGVTVVDKTYDGQVADYTLNLPDGVSQPSNWSAADYTSAAPTDAGTYKVSLSNQGIADLQAANPNYDIKDAKVAGSTFTIGRAPVTITANNAAMIYSGQKYDDEILTASISTLPAQGAKLHYTLSSNGATNVHAGGYPITVTASETDNPNYAITVNPGILTINPQAVTVGVTGVSKTYNGQAAQYTLNLPDGVQRPSNWGVADYTLIAPTDAGTYSVSLSDQGIADLQAANPNYDIQDATVTSSAFTISQQPVTIMADNATMSYSGQAYDDTKLTATETGLPTQGTKLHYTLSSNGVTDVNSSGYPITVTASDTDNPNYKITTKPGVLTISQKQGLSIGVTSADKPYDGQAVDYTLNLPDGVQQPSNWSAADYTLAAPTNAGTYSVSLSAQGIADLQAANPNYDIQHAKLTGSTFTISRVPVTITANNVTMIYSGQKYNDANLTATTSMIPAQGTKLRYTLSANGAIDVNGSGYPITVTASDTDNPNYTITVKPGVLTINQRQGLSIGVTSADKTYNGQATDYTLNLPDGIQLPSDWNAADYTLAAPTDAGKYSVSLSNQGIADLQAANPNYDIKDAKVTGTTFTISQAPVTIMANNATMIYSGQKYDDTTLTATISILPAQGAKLHYTLSSNGATNVNANGYPITVTASTTDNPNYAVNTIAGKLTITPNTQAMAQVQGSTKLYDGTTQVDPAQFNVKLSAGLMAPQWQADDFDLSEITSANVGSYAINLSKKGLQKLQMTNPNYTITGATPGQFQIMATPVTIIAPTLTKTYDGQSETGSNLQAQIVGLPTNEQAAKLNYRLTDLSQGKNVKTGGYNIAIQLGDNPNYDVKTVSGHLTINPKQLAKHNCV